MKKLAISFLRKNGYSEYFAKKLPRMFYHDLKDDRTNIKQKIWAWRNGFFSDKILEYGLTDKNKADYVPELSYYKLHPINGVFSKWIDDKLTTKLLLDGGSDSFMPQYYCVIEKGDFTPICEGKEMAVNDCNSFFGLLKSMQDLAVKKLAGTGGKDFYKISYKDGVYYINDAESSAKSIEKIFDTIRSSVVTEYLHADENIKSIYPDAPNAVRLMVVKYKNEFKIVAAFIRIGSSKTGVVDNASAGGISAGVSLDTGSLFSPKTYDSNNKLIDVDVHPDTQAKIEITLPHWQEVKNMVVKASERIGLLCFLGYDVVITSRGPKIIEINSHQALTRIQKYHPLGKNLYMQFLMQSIKSG